ncbi:receptor-type tyrosine-protein phosphatase epsilon-like [Ruditapes philippinarum]|uniref:receptor-type tyrosine-protein phosphatase epsilon-like n=1 Tax=Ruditapes philippinarum TaxID=129788 RepID=UPI00295BF376|nr:receptor-type tyrosine-protein phosphatase epsilon-like [Ruditapes philippinarum]
MTWSSQYLTISNISRDDDMNYNCSVYNIMTPTGKSPVKGTDSKMFHLSVEYKATIKDFFVNGYKSRRNVTINENDNATFICDVDSKPVSNTSLQLRTAKNFVWNDSNSLNHTLGPANCTDAGSYFCIGKNKHNIGAGSTEQLNLFVKCFPRHNPMFQYKMNVTSALNVTAILQFHFIAYPSPDTVLWQKYIISNWTNLSYKNNITTSRMEHNISLTVHNVSEEDFGRYRLIIANDVGNYTREFYINAEDIPKPPTGFHVINRLTTATTATVQWFPSFDGGKPQRFVLNYSKTHHDSWFSEVINDTEEPIMNYTINRLSSNTAYYITLHSENDIGSSELSERIEVHTKVIHVVAKKEITGIVIGSVCGVIGATVVVTVGICIFKKRRNEKAPDKMVYQNVPNIGKHKESKQTKRTSLIRETQFFDGGLQEVDDVPHIQYERTEYNNSPEKIKEIDTIRVSELFQYVLGQTEDDFAIEYQQIPTELQSSIAFARKPENIALNRYNGIFPYDHSRVKIPAIPDFFMNACYIDGYKRRNAYIASLGPTEKTTNNFITFWQMVWYEKSELIVMLTNLREPSGMKCEQYWPESGTTMTYGEMCVSSVKTTIFSEFTVKRFLLSKGKDQRPITHLHFTAWPDKTVPEDTTTLIEFRHQMKTTATSTSGPIIVHCSAGIGRTGTLIAFDRLVEEGQDKHDVNIFECVKSMRKQRVKMVQTLEQYIYIYKALVGTLCFESSYMTVKDLRSLVGTPKHMYSKEYQQLKQTVDTVKRDEKDALKSNENQTSKNRPGADIPGNRFRVFLNLNREHEDSDYINAVYINSFVKKEFFIVAQTPLPGATEDFICLIYQEDCTCVVSMMDQKDSYQKIGKYLPDGDKILKIGNFKVSCSVLETKHHYTLKKMKICYEGRYERGVKIVYHFQYTQWLAEMEIPDNNVDFVQFVKDVHQYACELGDERSHVLAHCLKANERSGLFCTVLIILEKLDKENQVNISNTIRHLRTRRRSAITSMEQLQFCYQAASVYAKQLKN